LDSMESGTISESSGEESSSGAMASGVAESLARRATRKEACNDEGRRGKMRRVSEEG
jgi:hypothetical protein